MTSYNQSRPKYDRIGQNRPKYDHMGQIMTKIGRNMINHDQNRQIFGLIRPKKADQQETQTAPKTTTVITPGQMVVQNKGQNNAK